MKKSWKRVISLVLTVLMVAALVVPASAADKGAAAGSGITWEKVPNDSIKVDIPRRESHLSDRETKPLYADDEVVRVSIVLNDKSTVEYVDYDAKNIANNIAAVNYRSVLATKQDRVAAEISAKVLNGAPLDVVHHLTLAANIISANVQYGKIEAIKALPSVKDVVLETRYEPAVVRREAHDPNMSVATGMIGGTFAWASGYNGAGSIVAIVDTGLDLQHQSMDGAAFEYAIAEDAKAHTVDLLTAEEVESVWSQLNASKFITGAEAVYSSAKVPFAVNYVDEDLDVSHENDRQSEHGSHVAGIAAGNRYVPDGNGGFADALDTVLTQGEAPDAQVLVMKVFGRGGGAYDSDYFCAIEDAIVLGADAVNLSLGTSAAGFALNTEYSELLDSLTKTDIVWANSASNNSYWAENTVLSDLIGTGYNYIGDNNFGTGGSPGTYQNAFTVASVDNDGITGTYLTAGGEKIFYTENTDYGNAPMTSIAGTHEFVFILGPGVAAVTDDPAEEANDNVGKKGDQFLALGPEVLSGKIAVCMRGTSSFFAKANAAMAQGAIGLIVVNNQAGTISMNLTGYTYNAPAVSVTTEDGNIIAMSGTQNDAGEFVYYTGTIEVGDSIGTVQYDEPYKTMSSFSSWGVPGNLTLKPEITAPGGNIYSINGAHLDNAGKPAGGHDQYENMSGTSMASPQMAGIAALMAQYIRENDLVAKTGLSQRALIQSLLMSTSEPLIEEESGEYYSVMKQGAGLVNVQAAMDATSYILMDDSANPAAADGKVKVELGDDPDRGGTYSASFTIHNFGEEESEYLLDAEFFTQDVFRYYAFNPFGTPVAYQYYVDTLTWPLESDLAWTVNGADFDADNDEVVIPAGGSAAVTLSFTLTDIDEFDLNGAYIEGFIHAVEAGTTEGVIGVPHSIPVLGYYGAWSESPMFDFGSALDFYYGNYEDGSEPLPYMYVSSALDSDALWNRTFIASSPLLGDYEFGGNPFTLETEYHPERNAISADSTLASVQYTQIRNSAAGRITVTDEQGTELFAEDLGGSYAAYYKAGDAKWYNTSTTNDIAFSAEGLAEGTVLTAAVTLATEYDAKGGTVDWDSLSENATYAITFSVDNTAPEVLEIEYDEDTRELGLTAQDNQYVATVFLYDEFGETIASSSSHMDAEAGDEYSETYDLSDSESDHLLVVVLDYAGNYTSYKINFNTQELQVAFADFDGDGDVDSDDVQALLDYVVGVRASIENEQNADFDGDGDIDTYDVHLFIVDLGAMELVLNADSLRLYRGSSEALTASVFPWASIEDFVWVSSDEKVATVKDGIVTAVAEGNAEITVTSPAYPALSAVCEVEVFTVPMTAAGVLQDVDGTPLAFSLDFGGDGTWIKQGELDSELTAASWDMVNEDRQYCYVQDWDGYIHKVNINTMKTEEISASTNEYGGLMEDIDFAHGYNMMNGTRTAFGVRDGYLLYSEDVMDNTFSYGWKLGGYLSDYSGATKFVAVAWTGYNEDNQDIFFALDDAGFLWGLIPDLTTGGAKLSLYETDLAVKYPTMSSGTTGNSLVLGMDDAFYLAHFNGTTSEFYQLAYVEETESFQSTRLGDVGADVWPVALFGVAKNEDIDVYSSGSDAAAYVCSFAGKGTRIAEGAMAAEAAALPATAPKFGSSELNSLKNTIEDPKVTVEIVLDGASTNGLYEISYDAEALTLLGWESHADFVSDDTSTDGKFVFGYACAEPIDAGETVLTLTFEGDLSLCVNDITVTVKESGSAKLDTEELDALGVGHEFGDPVWTWTETDGGYDASATFTCKNDAYEVTLDAESITSVITVQPSYYTEGSVVYTATLTFEGTEYTDTKEAALDKLPIPFGPGGGGSIPSTPTQPTEPTEPAEEDLPFVDVDKNAWYYEDVKAVFQAGLMKGTDETTFSPDLSAQRAMIVTMLYRLEGEPVVADAASFEDVAANAYYADSVAWALDFGVAKGVSEELFAPNRSVTREQLCTFVYRYAVLKGLVDENAEPADLTFLDADAVSDYALDAVKWCAANSLIQGVGDNSLIPQGTASRAQIAAIFNRMMKIMEKAG